MMSDSAADESRPLDPDTGLPQEPVLPDEQPAEPHPVDEPDELEATDETARDGDIDVADLP